MDARRFDDLARTLAVASGTHSTARRSALRLLVGAGLAALTRLGAAGALAQDCSEPAQPCPNCCDGLNCGAGNVCCIPTLSTKKCRKPLHCCTGVCKKKKGKPTGTCICRKLDQPCTAGRNCCSERCGGNGKCLAPCGEHLKPCSDGSCQECCKENEKVHCKDRFACTVDTCEQGTCKHPPNDDLCPDEPCRIGYCRPQSAGADEDGCVKLPVPDGQTAACPAPRSCVEGRCVCPDGGSYCPKTNSCGPACPQPQLFNPDTCQCECPSGMKTCGSTCARDCCGPGDCSAGPHTVVQCLDGQCRYICEGAFTDCNGEWSDGCECPGIVQCCPDHTCPP